MKTSPPDPHLPNDSPPLLETQTFDIEDSEDVMNLARQLINGEHPGILCTIDENGFPRARWMSTLSFEEMPVIYSLTSTDSRKVKDINRYHGVSWMFFNQDMSLILTLTGTAHVRSDAGILRRVWKQIRDFSHAYFLNHCTEGPGFVAIETRVERIECNSPKNGLRFALDLPAAPSVR